MEGSIAIACAGGRPAGHAPAGAARQRPGALRRAGGRVRSSSPPSPTASWRRRPRYLRLDGETPADPDRPESRGQIVVLDARPGRRRGRHARGSRSTGRRCPSTRRRTCKRVEITTRDIDRGRPPPLPASKEIAEAPESIRKTLRGRLIARGRTAARAPRADEPARRRVRDAPGARRDPQHPRDRPGHGRRGRAGRGGVPAGGARRRADPRARDALPAIGGERLPPARRHERRRSFVAISQSGTTTDTNRTVDLLRSRGARRDRDRQPARTATSPSASTACSTRATVATWRCRSRRRRPSTARSRRAPCSARRWRTRAAWATASGAQRVLRALAGAAGAHARPCWRTRRAIARGGAEHGAVPAPLGARRQRSQPGRRGGDPDQALRALLQVDRLRRDRGQEAHRPELGAADPRLRGRASSAATPSDVGQGGRDLRRPQGAARS